VTPGADAHCRARVPPAGLRYPRQGKGAPGRAKVGYTEVRLG